MAPGPPKLGDNRFASLSVSPRAKKKRSYQKFPEQFPELPETTQQNPRFLILASKNPDKPISDFSCFAVHRALNIISKEIISISTLRDGNLLMLVKSKQVADKFTKVTHLPGICDIVCKPHDSLNFVKGTIYAPYLINIPDEVIVEELKSQNVHSVFKFSRTTDGKAKPTGVILITFDLYSLPSKLDISWHSVKVREYIPNPMRCKTCQLLGHTAKHCKNPATCVSCNLAPHHPEPCTRTFCANCNGDHPASSPSCPQYQNQRDLLRIKTTKKCSMREARILLKQQQPKLSVIPLSSYAATAANQTITAATAITTNNKTTVNCDKQETLREPVNTYSHIPPPDLSASNTTAQTSLFDENTQKHIEEARALRLAAQDLIENLNQTNTNKPNEITYSQESNSPVQNISDDSDTSMEELDS